MQLPGTKGSPFGGGQQQNEPHGMAEVLKKQSSSTFEERFTLPLTDYPSSSLERERE